MQTAFVLLAVFGLALLFFVPHSKNRLTRQFQRGGSAALFAVGLCGVMVLLIMP